MTSHCAEQLEYMKAEFIRVDHGLDSLRTALQSARLTAPRGGDLSSGLDVEASSSEPSLPSSSPEMSDSIINGENVNGRSTSGSSTPSTPL